MACRSACGLRHERERSLGADQHVGVGDRSAHAGRHGLEAVVADADDVDFGRQGCCRMHVSGVRRQCNELASNIVKCGWAA